MQEDAGARRTRARGGDRRKEAGREHEEDEREPPSNELPC